MSAENAQRKQSLRSLWILAALMIAPVAASYVAYYFWQPSRHVNYGELLEPQPLPDVPLQLMDGTPFHWRELKGRWILVSADAGRCDEYCRRKLLYTRQLRLAQGKDAERVERVWLITDDAAPDAGLVAEHPGIWLVRTRGEELLNSLPAERTWIDHVYVVDPLGNLMMRYGRDPDPQKMLKDLSRLLRHSKWR